MGRYRLIYGETERVAEWAREQSGRQYHWSHLEGAIGLESERGLVAAAGYTDYIAGGSVSGHIVAKRMTPEFVQALLFYPFSQLQVRRLSALIPSKNQLVKRFVEHMGFTYEGCMERVFPGDDLLIYRYFREDWHG